MAEHNGYLTLAQAAALLGKDQGERERQNLRRSLYYAASHQQLRAYRRVPPAEGAPPGVSPYYVKPADLYAWWKEKQMLDATLSVQAAAQRAQVPRHRIYEAIAEHGLKVTYVFGERRIVPTDLDAWARAQSSSSGEVVDN